MRALLAVPLGLLLMAQSPAPARIGDLAWMAGSWESASGERWLEESWSTPRAGMMIGFARHGVGDALREFEFVRLQPGEDGVLTYFAQPQGRPAVPFRLARLEGTEAVFENHDLYLNYIRGGPGFGDEYKFNLATQGYRQPGSSFKTFVLLELLEQGYAPQDTISGSGPCRFRIPGVEEIYEVQNFGNSRGFTGSITAMTTNSSNCGYVRLGRRATIGTGDHVGQDLPRARLLLRLDPQLCLTPGVAQLDRDHGLDEQRLATARCVMNDALDPPAGLGLDRLRGIVNFGLHVLGARLGLGRHRLGASYAVGRADPVLEPHLVLPPQHVDVTEEGAAAVRLLQRRQRAHQRRLARPVRPEQPEDLAVADGEAQVVDGRQRAKALAEPDRLDHRPNLAARRDVPDQRHLLQGELAPTVRYV